MEIFPAIDLSYGQVVRLKQGDYHQKQIYSSNPLETALNFQKHGARNLHVVDLDGAKEGAAICADLIHAFCSINGLFVEISGGIREEKQIVKYLEWGADRIILGTAAINNPSFTKEMIRNFGSSIAIGVDARDGYVAIQGWTKATEVKAVSFCLALQDAGVKTIIYTDISKDGLLQGTNLDAYRDLRQRLPEVNIIASGGICSIKDLIALRDMGIHGAIIGKAIYENRLSLMDAIAITAVER